MYGKVTSTKIIIISLYIDDLVYTGNYVKLLEVFQAEMEKEFEISNMKKLCYLHGLEVDQNGSSISLSQGKYVTNLLSRYNMQNCKPISIPLAFG